MCRSVLLPGCQARVAPSLNCCIQQLMRAWGMHLCSVSLLQRHELAQLVNETAYSTGGASTVDAWQRTPGWCQVAGAIVALYGSVHQINCHRILAGMSRAAGRHQYRRPTGDWFDLVPCGHYLVRPPCLPRVCSSLTSGHRQAEVVIYSGLAVMCGCSDTSVRHGMAPLMLHFSRTSLTVLASARCSQQLLMLAAVASNLAISARETAEWYSRHTGAYHARPPVCQDTDDKPMHADRCRETPGR